ncbi:hypothetical protein [Streptomyces sp. NPDC101165]|uniref:hypothetical protein n=1 Tax=Streptomyces sp. NPDC101165 TaxID=3366119 RepID=UPI003828C3A6
MRPEAARQHADLTKDPDFMGVGEQLGGQYVRCETVAPEHGDRFDRTVSGTVLFGWNGPGRT